jgi:hypothetical protein
MTSKAAPKSSKKDGTAKKAGPKLVVADLKPGIGHNSGEKNPEAIKCIEELMQFQAQKKSIAKAERDVRNRLKSEFGILSTSVAREVALRKLDPDVRVQVESNHEDFKKMLGYQPQLDFVAGQTQPTAASAKAQPSEAELADKGDDEGFEVNEDEGENGNQHGLPQVSGVITREG